MVFEKFCITTRTTFLGKPPFRRFFCVISSIFDWSPFLTATTPRGRKRGGTRSDPVPPRTRLGFAEPPSRKERVFLSGSPRRRKPSPTGKVDRAQPGPDEGKQPKSEKQATLNGSVFHSMWPVSLLGCGPSSVTPYGVPPSPWGKATSRRGIYGLFWLLRFLALYGTMSKNRQAPGGKGGFFCPVSRPSRPLWSPL